ncbi:MAG: ribosome maturation factor RimP [Desulfovibrionaceae bacterium]|nr:ribosome maturation factor RimP [Desulfovibrionaceae bacterium]
MATPAGHGLAERLRGLIESEVRALGFDLWGLEAGSGPGKGLIRVYIDSPGGVDVDACAKVGRPLSVALDVEDAVPGSYFLEVSSPGLERRFFSPGQLGPYVGRTVEATLAEPMEGRRRITGTLIAAGPDWLTIEESGHGFRLDWGRVKRARLVHEFKQQEQPAKGLGRRARPAGAEDKT